MTIEYRTDLALDASFLSFRPIETYLNETDILVGIHWIRSIGPVLSWEKWQITVIHTESNSNEESKLWVYRKGRPIQGTYSGNFDSSDTNITLYPGESLDFKWENVSYDELNPRKYSTQIVLDGRRMLQGKLLY